MVTIHPLQHAESLRVSFRLVRMGDGSETVTTHVLDFQCAGVIFIHRALSLFFGDKSINNLGIDLHCLGVFIGPFWPTI